MNKYLNKLKNLIIDLKYGASLRGKIPSRYANIGAIDTENMESYDSLDRLLGGRVYDNDVLVDIGCGKGRVINWVLHNLNCRRVYGIELDPEIAEATARRLKNFNSVSIITGDACELLPDDATVFFLFNPFKKHVVERFRDAVIEHYGRMNTLQDIKVIYYNDRHRDVFSVDDRCMVEVVILPKDFVYSGASVVTFKPYQ